MKTLQKIWNYFRTQLKYIDKTFWILLGFFFVASCIFMFSASTSLIADEGIYHPILDHAKGLLIGIACAFVIQFMPSWFIRMVGYVGLSVSILLLILTFTPLFGHEINGEARWVKFGGLIFQPSELVKICLIIVVSDLLSRIETLKERKTYFWITLGLTACVCLLILPSNFSTAALIGVVMVLLLYLARIPIWWILGLGLLLGSVGFAGYKYVNTQYVEKGIKMDGALDRAETWVKRINRMVDGKTEAITAENFGDNYQANLAHTAVAIGGQSPFGVGPGNSWAKTILPYAHSDFIFAIICEETGVMGALLLIFLYLAVLFRACYASSKYADYSAMLMMMGLALMFTMQAFISMGVSVGVGPVTGQTLPLISHGKTSCMVFCLYFGIMMAVSREQKSKQALQEETINESEGLRPELEE